MKRRLNDAALPLVVGTVAGQQPVSQQLAGPLERAALGELRLVDDEDLADVIGMVDEERALAAHPEERNIAVVTGETAEERQRIPAGRDERAQQREPRTRGASRPLHGWRTVSVPPGNPVRTSLQLRRSAARPGRRHPAAADLRRRTWETA